MFSSAQGRGRGRYRSGLRFLLTSACRAENDCETLAWAWPLSGRAAGRARHPSAPASQSHGHRSSAKVAREGDC